MTEADHGSGLHRGESVSPGSPSTQTGTFVLNGEYWTIGYGGTSVSLRDLKGLGYIHSLLQHPGEEFHVFDILNKPGSVATSESGSSDFGSVLQEPTVTVGRLGDAGEMLDAKAKQDYRRRLSELDEELEDMQERGNVQRAAEVEDERDFLRRELARAVGLGGRDRRAGSAAERARLNVLRAIKAAVQKISEHDAALGELLSHTIKTGSFCCYSQDPRHPLTWQFSAGDPKDAAEPMATPSYVADRRSFPRVFADETTFVGREAERTTLRRVLEQARGGRGGTAMVDGPAGVGKTRLVAEICAEAARTGFLSIAGSCYDRDESVPFVPFVEILETALEQAGNQRAFRDALGKDAAEITRLLPQLRRLFPDIPPPMELPPDQSRRVLFNAVAEFVRRAAENSPLLIFVDDLHWADEGTLLLLNYLAQLAPKLRLLMVGTYRDFELQPARPLARALDELIRLRLVERITLRGLPQSAVASMLKILSGREPPDSIVRLFFSDTEGNPFFVEELFRHLLEQGKLTDSDGAFRRDLRLDEIEVPQSLRLVIGRRLARLTEATHKMLGTAAIIGRSFTFKLLEASTDTVEDLLLDCVEEAERAGLISSTVQYPEARFEFSHELIRQAVAGGLSVARRQRLHLEVAEALERIYANALEDRAEDLAHHLWQAGAAAQGAKTVLYLEMAAKRAREQGALAEAEGHYRHALAVIETMPAAPARDQQELILQLALAQVFIATRGYTATETAEAYDRASVLGERIGDPMQVVLTLTGLYAVPLVQGNMEAAKAIAERVWIAAERSERPSALIWGRFLQGVPRYHCGELSQARDYLEKAIAAYREEDHLSNPQDPGTETLQYLALSTWQLGRADFSRTRMREAIELADRLRKPYAFAHNRLFAAYLYALMRDPATSQQFSEALVELTREPPIPVLFDLGRILYGWSLAELGRCEEGARYARDGVTSFKAAGNGIAIGSWIGFLAEALARNGELGEALSTVEEGLAAVGDQLIDMPYLLWLRGELLMQQARAGTAAKPAEAPEQSFRGALALASRLGAKPCALRAATSLGCLLKSRERVAEARDLILPLWKSFAEGFDTRDLLEAKALLNELG
ncbi:MAG TPA: AAA family ATPase [Candidatus Binataceae bacterium]